MWIRKFRLELTGGATATYKELRMDFRYNEFFAVGDLTNMADTFDIDIFNLSADSFAALQSKDEIQLKRYTGYGDEDELSLAFEGIVSNVIGRRRIPEHITTLYCIPLGLAKGVKPVSFKGSREDTLEDVLGALGTELKLKIKFAGVKDIIKEFYRSKTIQGIGLEELVAIGKQFYFMPRVEKDELRIITLPEEGRVDKIKTIHKLEAQLIRGTPKASVAKLSIPYAFNTVIKTGDAIDVSEFKEDKNNRVTNGIGTPNGITDVSGLGKGSLHYSDTLYKWAIQTKYQIISAVHSGSNYTDNYITQYECVVYVPNKKG